MAEKLEKLLNFSLLEHYNSKIKTYIGEQIAGASHLTFKKVPTLPVVASAEANVIYLVPRDHAGQYASDVYDEYFLIDGKFEVIGSTDVDLSNYYSKADIDTLLAGKEGNIADLAAIRSGAGLGATAIQSLSILGQTLSKGSNTLTVAQVKTALGLGTASEKSADFFVPAESGKRLMTNAEGTKLAGVQEGATKVEASTSNGYIKINGTETKVFEEVAGTVHDASYVHTDNNYTTDEKTKLAGVAAGAQVNVIESVKFMGVTVPFVQGDNKCIDITPVFATTDDIDALFV